MTITPATLRRVKYYPEMLPDSGTVTMVATIQTAAQVQLRRFSPQVIRMANVQQPVVAGEMRVTADDQRYSPDLNAVSGQYEKYDLECLNYLDFAYYSLGGAANHTFIWGLWVEQQTIANKIARGEKLTAEETKMAEEYGISNSTEKGVIPLPIATQIEREYRPIQEYTRARRLQLAGAVTDTIDTIMVQPNEAIILTEFNADPGAILADGVRLLISRDEDDSYIDFPLWPVSGMPAGYIGRIPCWIPATRQIRLSVTSVNAVANWDVAYTVRRVRLTNTLRARWGLAPSGKVDDKTWADIQAKVKCGIL